MNEPKKPNFINGLIANFIFVSVISAFLITGYNVGGGKFNWKNYYQIVPITGGISILLTYLGYNKSR